MQSQFNGLTLPNNRVTLKLTLTGFNVFIITFTIFVFFYDASTIQYN